MEYVAYLKQDGEGCDYTIGCGNKLINLGEHSSIETAQVKLLDILHEEYNPAHSPEFALDEVLLLSFQCRIDMEKFNSDMLEGQTKEQEDLERNEYERLKKKFG